MALFGKSSRHLGTDQEIVFYPAFAAPLDPGHANWQVRIHGAVYNPRLPWLRRTPIMAMIRRAMRVDRAGEDLFRSRMRPFLVNPGAGKLLSVRVGTKEFTVGQTGLGGLFAGMVVLTALELAEAFGGPPPAGAWLGYGALLPATDRRQFHGESLVVDYTGLSVISDVDDTIKHSNVPNRRDLFQNTFARKFVPVPGMPHVYQQLAAGGAMFHYVSGSPWQLYTPLSEFLAAEGYPRGSFHLKPFRVRDTARKVRGMSPQKAYKRGVIEPILNAFPGRKFLLVGDSGEQDADIYASFLAERPDQIRGVFIRAVRGETSSDERFRTVFAKCPPEKWCVFQSAGEMDTVLSRLM